MTFPHQKKPCVECPWRRDVPTGKFSPRRYQLLAPSAYDMARMIFACHMSREESPVACAGWLLKSSTHNLSVRFAGRDGFDWRTVSSDVDLYDNYVELAVANGVRPNDPALQNVRCDQ